MAKRYQHVLDTIRKDVASQVGGLLWDGIEITPAEDSGDQDDDGDDGAPWSSSVPSDLRITSVQSES
jgi:hypothetical protein